MANIKITVEGPLMDGHKITFKAPCNCDVVEKLDVRYIENDTQKSKLFTMKDAHGNDLTGLGNLFYKNAYVDVVLDPNSGSAYLQNAGTNKYLEQKTTPVDNFESDRSDLPASARTVKVLNESLDLLQNYVYNLATINNLLSMYITSSNSTWVANERIFDVSGVNVSITATSSNGRLFVYGIKNDVETLIDSKTGFSGDATISFDIPSETYSSFKVKIEAWNGTTSITNASVSAIN